MANRKKYYTAVRRKNRYVRRKNRYITLLIIAAIIGICCLGWKYTSSINREKAQTGYSERGVHAIKLDDLYSRNAVLMEAESGEIIGEYRSRELIYPASITKIMTAVIAEERIPDLEKKVTMPPDIYQELYNENASMAGLEPGEIVTVRDLLYGVLLPSGAECCLTIAKEVSGSEVGFVKVMNEKAVELGMKDTHFSNATGLHDKEHYSTAGDMAVLLQYALEMPVFREVFGSKSYLFQSEGDYGRSHEFLSTLFSRLSDCKVTGGTILGGKTGYTEEAGQCLASAAEINGKEYILVTTHADGSGQTDPFHILDAVKVFNRIGQYKRE